MADQQVTDRAKSLKQDQTDKKRQVTLTARKLEVALATKKDSSHILKLHDDLEKCWSDFESVHIDFVDHVSSDDSLEEFKTVNGLSFDDYRNGVYEVYSKVATSLFEWKNTSLEANHNAVKCKLRLDISRLAKLSDNIHSALATQSADKSKLLSYINGDIDPLVDCCSESVVAMNANELNDELLSIIEKIDAAKLICTLSSTETIKTEIGALPPQNFISVTETDNLAVSESFSFTHVSGDCSDSSNQAASGGLVRDAVVGRLTVGSNPELLSTNSQSIASAQSVMPTYQSSAFGNSAGVTAQHGPSLTYPYNTVNQVMYPGSGSLDYCTSGSNTIVPTMHHPSSSVHSLHCPSSGLSAPTYHYTSGSDPVTSIHRSRSSPYAPFLFSPIVSASGVSPTNLGQQSSSATNFDVHVKRSSLPEFSGHRKDWPEFKAVWRELAERTFGNRTALAYELKKSLKGAAKDRVKNIYITRPEAYDLMWQRLSEYYDDCSASVQSALESLHRLKPVQEEDFKGLVQLVDEFEAAFAQLSQLGQTDLLSMREIDRISELLPTNTRMLWIRLYHQLDVPDKVRPLENFMRFLVNERASVVRLAELQKKKGSHHTSSHAATSDETKSGYNKSKPSCAVHKQDEVNHKTIDCKEFQKLSLDNKYASLRNVHACFKCFGYHRRDQCRAKVFCDICKKPGHLTLMCKGSERKEAASSSSHTAKTPVSGSLYAIFQTPVGQQRDKYATIFCDNGSSSSYITHSAAARLGAKSLGRYALDVTTMGNSEQQYDTNLYEVILKTKDDRKVPVLAFGMKEITGPVSILNLPTLKKLFPGRDMLLFQRKSTKVDILLGCDYFGLHPKNEVCSAGSHLSIMQGDLGQCIQGYHPDLREETEINANMVRTLHASQHKASCNLTVLKHPELLRPTLHGAEVQCVKTGMHNVLLNFIQGEELATEVVPKCGGCRCNKCPSVGHTFSFQEEQELKLIRDNLKYNEEMRCWVTSYPWLIDPSSLPDNYSSALATLKSTEITLRKDPLWAAKYCEQIKDMLSRNVARKLCVDEIQSWHGARYYISHLAVKNPRSPSTPIRIVFNSSQVCRGVSLNSVLAKGPDAYLNNLVGLLLRWREGWIALVGDIKKMFHSVHLETLEQHCHRFLWRDLEERPPDEYVMLRVNMGDRPAPAICTEALYMTAEKFEDESPRAAYILKRSTYVDDILDSFPDENSAKIAAEEVENMLAKGGFKVKCWQMSRENSLSGTDFSLLKSDGEDTRVLGVSWIPKDDILTFKVVLNFSQKRRGERCGPNLQASDVPSAIPAVLSRRLVLQQVMMLFDPLGFICPFTLQAKLLLRDTWSMKLGWDDPLPESMRAKWLQFFSQLFELEKLKFDRSLHPPSTAVSKPTLILFSDGSDKAYGFVAYIRWQLESGDFFCRLIMAKCRIAPLRKLTTPQMELNAAVLSKRGRKVIEKEMRYDFEHVIHIVDSETVLNMLNKTSTRFKVFEGVRIGEIQNATNGDISCWSWMSGAHNIADLLSRGCSPDSLSAESEWWKGPAILYKPMEEWELKSGLQKDTILPGEKRLTNSSAAACKVTGKLRNCVDFSRYSKVKKLIFVVALVKAIVRSKSFHGALGGVTPELLREAEHMIVLDAQDEILEDLNKRNGRFSSLSPFLHSDGLWVVGSRLQNYNPMVSESHPQVLLPSNHPVTRLLMKDAHEAVGHRGRDATLARFRQRYWTPYGSKLAWSAKSACQLCKLREPILLSQEMGVLPISRVKPAPAFNSVMVDLFGPYKVRGEVNKRSTGKAYGVLFTDLVMRAVHVEAVFGYDTNSFLLGLSRFASMRGWPEKIYSDPGTQLVGADNELRDAWLKIDQSVLRKKGSEKGLLWIFGPADSPWYQGAVESLVKAAKRSIDFAVHNQRLSASELLTLFAEVSNLLNERPIGALPGPDAEISILTPNCLLLGRATAVNPGGWQPQDSGLATRYHLVQSLTDSFWRRWIELCAPGLVVRRKWHNTHRNLKVGDVVVVTDKNALRGDYRIALVKEVFPDTDGKVRKVSIMYKNFKIHNQTFKATETVVTRAIQRLAVLVPVDGDEQL